MARTYRKISENNYRKKTITTSRRKGPRLQFILILFVIGTVLCDVEAEDTANTLPDQSPQRDTESLTQNGDVAKSETPSTTTYSGSTVSTSEQPPVPQGASRDNTSTKTVLNSILYITVIVTISVIGVLAIVGGMLCWYKHASIMSASRRVFYRSSDASVLIRNDYQTMSDSGRGEIKVEGYSDMSLHEIPNRDLARLAEKTDYPAYGVTGPNPLYYSSTGPPIDTNLNRNAEVYHYHQQKQKLKALESASIDGSSLHQTSETQNETSETTEGDEENSDGEYTVYECPGLASTTDGPLEIHNPLFADIDTSYNSYGTSLGLSSSPYSYGATLTN